ncbi:CBF/Mak21 family-domain-containing protein [Podospora didyma]|uniref:CBF/Mak21 family-domain-containing protein n=1 Tax=Podospora didyma TaxID=330526 RepID=A0AAE0P8A0_9PEZI|nr:CBF/Mak21 family-domain-containing protein [Podospora didyma]
MGSTNRTKKQKKTVVEPSFDENALEQLTTKIDMSLSKSEELSTNRKRPHEGGDDADSKRRQIRPSGQKDQERRKAKSSENSTADTLLEEILALGGDQDDLELVANVDSGDEGGDAEKPKLSQDISLDKSFRDELAKFASSLGISNVLEDDDVHTDDASEEFSEDIEAGDEEDEHIEEDNEEQDEEDKEEEEEEEEEREAEVVKKAVSLPQDARHGKHTGKLIFEPRPDWHGVSIEGLISGIPANIKPYLSSVANLKAYAESLLEQDAASYSAMQSSRSTQKFMSTIMLTGTLSDKVSALTLSIQESPLHNRKPFENLINLAGKKSRGQAIAALGALVDLLGNGTVLPGDRRLRPFNAQPALLGSLAEAGASTWMKGQKLPGRLTTSHLMMWAFEDWLKSAYFRIIQLLEVWCSDEIEYSRSRALDFVFGLLKDKPEQEANLLRLLVNKLGDRDRKIASRASFLLLQLLNAHPGMKGIVINAIEQEVLLKPGQNLRTRYYAINTLNQTILSSKEPSVADSLLRIYFEIFLSLLKSGDLGSLDTHDAAKKPDSARKKNKKWKPKPPSSTDTPTNEEETAQKLVSSLLTGVNRAVPFTKADDSTLEKHLDTLFRITHSSNFNTSVQALMLIQQLATSKHLAVERFYRTLYESLLDPRLVTSSKQALYLNLLYRSMKNDVDVRRVKAFVKRLVQVLNLHQPSFACGILFLIAELENTFPDLHALLDVPEDIGDDGEEVYKDVPDEEPSHGAALQEAIATTSHTRRDGEYDGRKRDPEHSNAHRSCLWEIIPFLSHFHPSVAVFASNVFIRQKSLPKPELASHTLMHFLDKFVYRNPKASETKRGGSIMQPVHASSSSSHVVISSKASARQEPAVNSASFWNLKPDQVSAEDAFFHEYFTRIGKPTEDARTKKPAADVAGSDDEAEAEIWDALVSSRPEVEGADEDEEDLEMKDYDDYDDDLDLDLDLHDSASEMSDEDGPGEEAAFEDIFHDSEDEMDSEGEVDEDAETAEEEKPKGKNYDNRQRRKEMKAMPTFASADDFAEMMAAEDSGLDDQ